MHQQPQDPRNKRLQVIAQELKHMAKTDQTMRLRWIDHSEEWDNNMDHQHTEQLRVIVLEIGWPSISKVGTDGSFSAWLLIQHADHDPAFQKMCLALMKDEPEGDVSKSDIAYLEDRISVGENKPQLYGTQYYLDARGQAIPRPIMDMDTVDLRRTAMGLETLDEAYTSPFPRKKSKHL